MKKDYILKEDVFMALTGDITDCTIEEFIARLRDKLVKLPVKELPKAEVSLVNDSQDLVKQLESLESEYNAYHLDNNDYWRGVKHAIEVLKFRQA